MKLGGAMVLLLAKGYLPDDGGIERYSREMAQAYASLGYHTYVLTQRSGPTGVSQDGDVTVENVGQKGGQVGIFLRMLSRLHALRRRQKFDLVHATTWRTAAPAFALYLKAPIVITVHGREVLVVPRYLRSVMRYFLRHARLVAAVSPTTERLARLAASGGKNLWLVVWNGLSFAGGEKSYDIGDRRLRIYTFCRLVERKNLQNALRAVAELVRRGHDNFDYVIAGDGPLRPELMRLAASVGLEERVTFLGRIADEDVPALYGEADIFLHPQISAANGADMEGFGLTIADAMSFGAAAVVGADGGPADFIKNDETGLIVDGHSPVAVADALERLLIDKDLRQTLSRAGRQWVLTNLSWRKSAKKILSAI